MKKDNVLESLGKLKLTLEECHKEMPLEFIEDDIIALDYAIKKVKKDKAYMSSYWQGAWHMFLLIFLVKVIDVLITIFWG